MIEQISEAQLSKIPKYADKWKEMLFSSAPTDEKKAVVAINTLYENAGIKRPSHIFFLKSPMGCYLAKGAIDALIGNQQSGEIQGIWDKVKDSYLKKRVNEPGETDLEAVFAEVAKSIGKNMDGKTWPLHVGRDVGKDICYGALDALVAQFHERFGVDAYYEIKGELNSVGGLYAGSGRFLEDILDDTLVKDKGRRPNFEECKIKLGLDFSGVKFTTAAISAWQDYFEELSRPCHRNFSVDFYAHMFGMEEFFANELRIPSKEKLTPLIDISEESGWVLPYANVCFVSHKPIEFHLDDKCGFHKFGGKALEYADGWGIWAINSVQMPGKYAREIPDNWKSEWLLETSNAEQRRVIISVIGYAKIMRELGATQIHSDSDMSLHKIDRDYDVEPVYLLKVKCPSTGAGYALRVPPHVKTCEEARMVLMRNSKGNYTFMEET